MPWVSSTAVRRSSGRHIRWVRGCLETAQRKAFGGAIGRRRCRPEPGRGPRGRCLPFAWHHADQGLGVSCLHLLLHWAIAIELAEQRITVPSCPIGEVRDERLDLSLAGVAERWGTAIISGIGLHEAGIEPVLADQQAELVAEARLTVLVAVVSIRGKSGLTRSIRPLRSGRPAQFFYRTKANAIGFAEGAIDGTSLGDAHLGAVD